MLHLDEIRVDGCERVVPIANRDLGMVGFIAIHSLGFWPHAWAVSGFATIRRRRAL